MRGQLAFFKKEFQEIFRTYKVLVIPAIFILLGLASPILAKLTPEMLKQLGTGASGVIIKIPPPTAVDAYSQWFKNMNQICMLVVILTSIGLVTDEKTRGTALLIVTKPVRRWVFITAKYLATAVLVTVSTLISYAACCYYTDILFKQMLFKPSLEGAALVAGYFLLLVAIALLASTVGGSQALSGGIAIGGLIVISLLPVLFKPIARYLPGSLSSLETELLTGGISFGEAVPALLVTLGLAALLVVLAVILFGRQEL